MQRHLQRQVVHLSTRRQTPLPRRVVSLDVAYRSWAPGKTFGAGRCAVVCRYSEHAEPVNPGKEEAIQGKPCPKETGYRQTPTIKWFLLWLQGQMYGGTLSMSPPGSTAPLPAETSSSIVPFRRAHPPNKQIEENSTEQPVRERAQSEASTSTSTMVDTQNRLEKVAQARNKQQARRRQVLAEREAFLANQWYNIGISSQVKDKPVQTQLFGKMLVLFRGQHGRLHCLADECPHRAAPLSSGRIELVDGHACVVCPYHDWAISSDGALRDVPAQRNDLRKWSHCKAKVKAFSVQEKGGFIWLFWGKLSADQRPPIPFVPELEDRSWRPVYGSMEFECPHWGVFENAMDVAHIHSLHTSDFGNQERPEIQIIHDPAVKRDEAQGVTMQFALHNKATNPVWRLFQVDEVIVTAKAMLPSTSVISFTLGNGLSFITFVNTVPVSATRTVNRFALIRKLNVDPVGAAFFNWPAWDVIARKAMLKILGEDKVMVEQLRPEALLLEHSVPADELQLAFRSKRAKFANDLVAPEGAHRMFDGL